MPQLAACARNRAALRTSGNTATYHSRGSRLNQWLCEVIKTLPFILKISGLATYKKNGVSYAQGFDLVYRQLTTAAADGPV